MTASQFKNLFNPIKIGNMLLRNRVVMAPMSTNFGDSQNPGHVSEKHKSYYTARAEGGVGLIIVEATNVNPSSSARKFGLSLHADEFVSGFGKLVELIKKSGAKCAIQLNHSGRIGPMKVDSMGCVDRKAILKNPYFSVSPLAHPVTGLIPKQLNRKQLKDIMGYFINAVKRAKVAGFDAVELHGAHGYLLNEFISSHTNQRSDEYGGSFENRCRFAIELVRRIKEAVKDDMVLSYRISAIDGGISWKEVVLFAKALQRNGVQVLHVSAGTNETLSAMNKVIPPMSFPKARLAAYSEKLNQELALPVIVVQRIATPELADEIIGKKKADLVALGRALISDPRWPEKARMGRQDEIRKCIYCNQGCIENIIKEKSIGCLQNPEVGNEIEYGLENNRKMSRKKGKKALVIGGGVAGMEAAYILSLKGYDVELIEKENQLGGNVRIASLLDRKMEFGALIDYFRTQLLRMDVKIKLNSYADPAAFEKNDIDQVVIATGSLPLMPKVLNSEKKCRIVTARNALQNPHCLSDDILIIGGNSVGIETAEYLCGLNKKITIMEMAGDILKDLGPLNRSEVIERIKHLQINVLTNHRFIEVNDSGLSVSNNGKAETYYLPDDIVVAMGAIPYPLPIKHKRQNVHYVGDCKRIGNAMDAIHDAFHTVNKL